MQERSARCGGGWRCGQRAGLRCAARAPTLQSPQQAGHHDEAKQPRPARVGYGNDRAGRCGDVSAQPQGGGVAGLLAVHGLRARRVEHLEGLGACAHLHLERAAAAQGVNKLTGGPDQIQSASARPPPELTAEEQRRAQEVCAQQGGCPVLPEP